MNATLAVERFALESGEVLRGLTQACQVYGRLNARRDNAV